MAWIMKGLMFLSLKQLLILMLAILKVIATKTKNKADDEFVMYIEQIISYFNEYSKNI